MYRQTLIFGILQPPRCEMNLAGELNQIDLGPPKVENVGFEPAFLHFVPNEDGDSGRVESGSAYLFASVRV